MLPRHATRWIYLLFLYSTHSLAPPNAIQNYDFVQPKISFGIQKSLSLSLSSFNQSFELKLQPNLNLIYPGAVIHHFGSDAPPHAAPLESQNIYDGSVHMNGYPVGWARVVMSHSDFLQDHPDPLMDGVFTTPNGMYHIKQISAYRLSKRDHDIEIASPFSRHASHRLSKHILIKDRESAQWVPDTSLSVFTKSHSLLENDGSTCPSIKGNNTLVTLERRRVESLQGNSCGFNGVQDNADALAQYLDTLGSSHKLLARAPQGCPSSRKILVMAAAADCSYVSAKGGPANALNAILANWNAASKVYETTFNVQLALVKVSIEQICTPDDASKTWNRECTNGYTISDRLSDFSKWRGTVKDEAGLWHLMTKCGTQPSVGIAWLSMLCSKTAFQQTSGGVTSWVSGTGVSSIVPVEWKVVAHEIGHMMHPLDSSSTDTFSPCSISTICGSYSTLGSCLVDSSSLKTVQSSICGNGVKEGEEECDCGTAADCQSDACCDGATCKLKPGKTCDDRNDACCSNCILKTNGTVCRVSTGVCDKSETCDGKSPDCPKDSYNPDGTSCNVNGTNAQCASGQCTSRDLQCQGRGIFNSNQACPAFVTECTLYCQDESGTCLQFNGIFLDGTPCGESGKCEKGSCSGTNFFLEALGWYKRNLNIAVPVTVVIVGLILFMIWSCISGACAKCRRNKRRSQRRSSRLPPSTNRASQYHQTLNPQWSLPSIQESGGFDLRTASVVHGMNPGEDAYMLQPIPTRLERPQSTVRDSDRASAPPPVPDKWVDPTEYNGYS